MPTLSQPTTEVRATFPPDTIRPPAVTGTCGCDRDVLIQPSDRTRKGQWEDSNALCSHDVPTLLPSASLVRCLSPSPSLEYGETGLWVGWHTVCTLSIRLCGWQKGELPPLRRKLDPPTPLPAAAPRAQERARVCCPQPMSAWFAGQNLWKGETHTPPQEFLTGAAFRHGLQIKRSTVHVARGRRILQLFWFHNLTYKNLP